MTTVIATSRVEPDAEPYVFTTRKELGHEEAKQFAADHIAKDQPGYSSMIHYSIVEKVCMNWRFHVTHRGPITKW